MSCLPINRIFIYSTLICLLLGCEPAEQSSIESFKSIVSESDRIIVRFKEDKNFSNSKTTIRIINKPPVIRELNDLMQQSEDGSNCSFISGTMTFFSGAIKKGYLEFSVDPDCPAFYLHISEKVQQYKMSAFCGMFLEGIRQGEK